MGFITVEEALKRATACRLENCKTPDNLRCSQFWTPPQTELSLVMKCALCGHILMSHMPIPSSTTPNISNSTSTSTTTANASDSTSTTKPSAASSTPGTAKTSVNAAFSAGVRSSYKDLFKDQAERCFNPVSAGGAAARKRKSKTAKPTSAPSQSIVAKQIFTFVCIPDTKRVERGHFPKPTVPFMNALWKAQLIQRLTLPENAAPSLINSTVHEAFNSISQWTSTDNFRLLQCQQSPIGRTLQLETMDDLSWSQLLAATSGSWVKGCAKAYPKPVYFILPLGCESIPFTSSIYASDLGDTDIDIDESDSTEKEEKESSSLLNSTSRVQAMATECQVIHTETCRALYNICEPSLSQPWWPQQPSNFFEIAIKQTTALIEFLQSNDKDKAMWQEALPAVLNTRLVDPLSFVITLAEDLDNEVATSEHISLGPYGIHGIIDSVTQTLKSLQESKANTGPLLIMIEQVQTLVKAFQTIVSFFRNNVHRTLWDPPNIRDFERMVHDIADTFPIAELSDWKNSALYHLDLSRVDPSAFREAVESDFGSYYNAYGMKTEAFRSGKYGLQAICNQIIIPTLDEINYEAQLYQYLISSLKHFCFCAYSKMRYILEDAERAAKEKYKYTFDFTESQTTSENSDEVGKKAYESKNRNDVFEESHMRNHESHSPEMEPHLSEPELPHTPEPEPHRKRKSSLFSPPRPKPTYSKRYKRRESNPFNEPSLPATVKQPEDCLSFAHYLDHHTDWTAFFMELIRKIEHPTDPLRFRLKLNDILLLSNRSSGVSLANQQYKFIAQFFHSDKLSPTQRDIWMPIFDEIMKTANRLRK